MVTHAIVGPDDPEPGELGPGAAVVTPAWVEWAIKFGTLPPAGSFVAWGIFRGVVACSAGMQKSERYVNVTLGCFFGGALRCREVDDCKERNPTFKHGRCYLTLEIVRA